ncbi:hypothetical protein DMUE_2952 [Dictyocoela muelleri]|nr:hypothetical protein DMUE_2952 [Dictyocoela muelleri]
MGSVTTKKKNTLGRNSLKKIKTGVIQQSKDIDTNSNQINYQDTKFPVIDSAWLAENIKEFLGKGGRIRKGGWQMITAKYNLTHDTNLQQIKLRNFYIKNLRTSELIQKHNENDDNSREVTDVIGKNDENAKSIIKNNEIKNKKEITLSENIIKCTEETTHAHKVLHEIYIGLKIDEIEKWNMTPKFSSLVFKKQILETINQAVLILIKKIKIIDINEIVKILYATQQCYYKLTLKKPKPNNWIDNIKNKIKERETEIKILNDFIEGKQCSKEFKTLKKIHNRRNAIESDISQDTFKKDNIQKIIYDIENEISLYMKRLEVHQKKKNYLKENYLFECSRKKFYRNISS